MIRSVLKKQTMWWNSLAQSPLPHLIVYLDSCSPESSFHLDPQAPTLVSVHQGWRRMLNPALGAHQPPPPTTRRVGQKLQLLWHTMITLSMFSVPPHPLEEKRCTSPRLVQRQQQQTAMRTLLTQSNPPQYNRRFWPLFFVPHWSNHPRQRPLSMPNLPQQWRQWRQRQTWADRCCCCRRCSVYHDLSPSVAQQGHARMKD